MEVKRDAESVLNGNTLESGKLCVYTSILPPQGSLKQRCVMAKMNKNDCEILKRV